MLEYLAGSGKAVNLIDLALSLGIVGGGILLAVLVYRLMKKLVRITGRSRFQIDVILVRVTAYPLAILITTLSFLYAFRRIRAIRNYMDQWEGLDQAIFILIGAWMLGSLVRELIDIYGQPFVESTETDFDERLLSLLDLTGSYIIYVIGFLAALHTLGIKITAFLASLGIAGLAVALATKTILSNFFGGLILTTDPYIQQGHRVKISDWVGDVEDITLYKTTIRTRDNLLVSIPNDVLMQQTTVNYRLPESLTRVQLDIGVAYGSDLDHVTDVLLKIIEDSEQVTSQRKPEVNVVELADSAIILRILAWQTRPEGARRTRDHIFRDALKRFEEENIEIPYPHLDVALREE